MKNFAIACIACLALTTLLGQVQGVEYHLAKFLDNSDIPDTTQGATVALTLSEADELEFTASHLLFGGHSPSEASMAIGTCQQRPFDNLYDYEVRQASSFSENFPD